MGKFDGYKYKIDILKLTDVTEMESGKAGVGVVMRLTNQLGMETQPIIYKAEMTDIYGQKYSTDTYMTKYNNLFEEVEMQEHTSLKFSVVFISNILNDFTMLNQFEIIIKDAAKNTYHLFVFKYEHEKLKRKKIDDVLIAKVTDPNIQLRIDSDDNTQALFQETQIISISDSLKILQNKYEKLLISKDEYDDALEQLKEMGINIENLDMSIHLSERSFPNKFHDNDDEEDIEHKIIQNYIKYCWKKGLRFEIKNEVRPIKNNFEKKYVIRDKYLKPTKNYDDREDDVKNFDSITEIRSEKEVKDTLYPFNLIMHIFGQKSLEMLGNFLDNEKINIDSILSVTENAILTLSEDKQNLLHLIYRDGVALKDILLKDVDCSKEISEEIIRQYQRKVMRMLRHPSRSSILRKCLLEYNVGLYITHYNDNLQNIINQKIRDELGDINKVSLNDLKQVYYEFYPIDLVNDCINECVNSKKDYICDLNVYDSMSIDELDLSARSHNMLKKSGVNTFGELRIKSLEDLKNMGNLGDKSLEEIRNKMKEYGVILEQNNRIDTCIINQSLKNINISEGVLNSLEKYGVNTILDILYGRRKDEQYFFPSMDDIVSNLIKMGLNTSECVEICVGLSRVGVCKELLNINNEKLLSKIQNKIEARYVQSVTNDSDISISDLRVSYDTRVCLYENGYRSVEQLVRDYSSGKIMEKLKNKSIEITQKIMDAARDACDRVISYREIVLK